MKRIVLAVALLAGLASGASAQVGDLAWWWSPDGTFSLQNPTDSSINFDGYTIACEAGCLDPDGWRSISDAVLDGAIHVIEQLGSGALPFGTAGTPSESQLSELNLASAATLQPGGSWEFGKPIVGTITQIREWEETGVLTVTMSGDGIVAELPIEIVPEPSSLALAAAATAALACLARRRP